MRSLPPFALDSATAYDKITAAKKEQTKVNLKAARTAVLAAYDAYDACVPDLETLPEIALSADQSKALRHAYTSSTKPLQSMRRRLLDRPEAARCPFCDIGEASTLDHYLPKELAPAFAVYAPNLVPACSPCNTRKSDKILNQGADNRLFLHPYYDPVPNAPFLTASIRLRPSAVLLQFELTRPPGVDRGTHSRIQSHFERLGLALRYRVMGLDRMRSDYRAFARYFGPDANAARLSRELADRAQDAAQDHGVNNWIAVLYQALSEHQPFCNGGFHALKTP